MNTPSGHNPYKPPEADVTPPVGEYENGEFIDGGQSVSPGNAISWIGGGWTLFTKAPGIWILNLIILFVMAFILGKIPYLGSIASNLLMPVFLGGLMLGCKSLDNGDAFRVDHLFAGFAARGGQLVLVGLLLLVATIVMVIVAVIIAILMFGVGLLQSLGDQQAITSYFAEHGWSMMLLMALVVIALCIPLGMMYWFTPALVVLQELDAVGAIKQSFRGGMKNIVPVFVFAIVMLVLAVIGAIPIGLGLLVVIPMGYAAQYVAYKDVFVKE